MIARWWRGSLRVRLLAVVTVLLVIGLGVVSVTAVLTLRSFTLSRIDQELRAVPQFGLTFRPDADLVAPESVSQYLTSTVITRLDPSTGKVLQQLSGPALTGLALPDLSALAAAVQAGTVDPDELVTVPDLAGRPDAYRARIIGGTSVPGGGVVVIARSLDEVQAAVRTVAGVLAATSAVLLAALLGAGMVLLRAGLRPLTEVEAAVERVGAGDLSARVPHAQDGDEVARLAAAFNSMTDQIQAAFESEEATQDQLRQFVADASHELRTPLTSIRAYAELFSTGAFTADPESATAMHRIQAEAIRMSALVDDLLLLARLDHAPELQLDHVDLAALAADAVVDARAVAPGHVWSLDASGSCAVIGDEARLRQILGNLTRNAAIHTPEGTTVHVLVDGSGDTVTVTVHDDGPGMTPQMALRAFDRFSRADPSRTRSAAGTGLGLAIVRAVAVAHGGSATVSSAPGEGTEILVRIPTTPGT